MKSAEIFLPVLCSAGRSNSLCLKQHLNDVLDSPQHAMQVHKDTAKLQQILKELCPNAAWGHKSHRALCHAYDLWLAPITADMPGMPMLLTATG